MRRTGLSPLILCSVFVAIASLFAMALASDAQAQWGPCPRGYQRNRFGRCVSVMPAPPPPQCPFGTAYSNGRCWRTSPGCPVGFVRNRFGRCMRAF